MEKPAGPQSTHAFREASHGIFERKLPRCTAGPDLYSSKKPETFRVLIFIILLRKKKEKKKKIIFQSQKVTQLIQAAVTESDDLKSLPDSTWKRGENQQASCPQTHTHK